MLPRDFYIFTALKHGEALLSPGGLQGTAVQWQHNPAHWAAWAGGLTGAWLDLDVYVRSDP